MHRIAFLFLLCVASALLAWAFSNNGKEAAPVFLLGAALLLCTLAVGGIRLVTGNRSLATGHWQRINPQLGLQPSAYFPGRWLARKADSAE